MKKLDKYFKIAIACAIALPVLGFGMVAVFLIPIYGLADDLTNSQVANHKIRTAEVGVWITEIVMGFILLALIISLTIGITRLAKKNKHGR